MRLALPLMLAILSACTIVKHPVTPAVLSAPSGSGWQAVLAGTPVEHEAVISARWAVPRKGLIDLKDPKAAHLEKGDMDIVLPVHVLAHPELGVFVVDTGITRDRANGGDGAVKGALKGFTKDIEPGEPLMDIVERQNAAFAGVLLTHAHPDHVLGLADVPRGTPIYTGVGEMKGTHTLAPLMRPTYKALFEGHDAVREIGDSQAVSLGPVSAVDLIGDGSIWAIPSPGHTDGSLAFLARTQDGVALFTGDTSHTQWGWDHGVTPGTFTHDHDANAQSLNALKELVALHPQIEVYVGHELEE